MLTRDIRWEVKSRMLESIDQHKPTYKQDMKNEVVKIPGLNTYSNPVSIDVRDCGRSVCRPSPAGFCASEFLTELKQWSVEWGGRIAGGAGGTRVGAGVEQVMHANGVREGKRAACRDE
jgi:hypothetical protein